MQPTRFQHYVPRSYLENFCFDGSRVHVFDKPSLSVFQVSIKSVGGEAYFYETPEEQTARSAHETIEQQFCEFEGPASAAFKRWIEESKQGLNPTFSEYDRWQVSVFLSLQIFRTLEHRKTVAQFFEVLLSENPPQAKPQYSRDEMRELGYFVLTREEEINKTAEKIDEGIWVFARNDSNVEFYTSDNPVCLKSNDNKKWLSVGSFHSEKAQIIFPIGPRLILYVMDADLYHEVAKYDESLSTVDFTDHMADHENSGQVGFSTKHVYARSNNFDFARMLCDLHPEIRDPNRERFDRREAIAPEASEEDKAQKHQAPSNNES